MQEGESEFVSALNAALEGFVHRTLKEQQRECVLRIVCVKKDVFAVLPTGFGKSAIYQLIPKVLSHMGRTADDIKTTCCSKSFGLYSKATGCCHRKVKLWNQLCSYR